MSERMWANVWYGFWKGLLASCFWLLFGLRVEGREHEPESGPVLAVCNHVSAVDPPIAGVALHRRAWYMAKEELLRTPVLGPLLRSVGTFPVRRGEADRQSIRTALQVLGRGRVLLMFPEGTRSPDGRLLSAEPGAALLALRTGVAVLPMAVVGTHRAMPKGARLPRRTPVTVRIGPAITVPRHEGRIDRAVLDEWGRRFMAAIAALLPPDQQPRV
ncbi:MAG: 1-acyl-sn-glycerol-3-phosphate acyltransferase [Armatimonadetes bacterium]|nr:1-acyl-sn-glycerol-3-phosphate acyltransferase [Armatimonadota bacterium]